MKRCFKLILFCASLASNVFALKDWNSGVVEVLPSYTDAPNYTYVEKITSPGAKAGDDLIIGYDKDDYLLNDHCNDITDDSGQNFKDGVFSVKALNESLEKVVEDEFVDRWHWMLKYSMQYTITCGNHITYKGYFFWRVQLWSCKMNCDDDVDRKTYAIDLKSYNYLTNTFEPHRERAKKDKKNIVPIGNLIAAWNGREVAYPKYEGGINRLEVPVILVPGFNADYKNTWGVEIPDTNKHSVSFKKGFVSSYVNGGLPDILARYQGLDVSEQGINSNGIYFF